jgi:hypothetical protein
MWRASPRSVGGRLWGRLKLNACAWDPAMPLRQRGAGRRSVAAIGADRSIGDRLPGTTCGRCKRFGRGGVDDAGEASPGFAASDRDAAA